MSRDIFYFAKTKTFAWVAGYCADLNTDNLAQKIASLTENATTFAKMGGGILQDQINTYEVTHSQRYKHMRVFYAENVERANIPADTFCFEETSDWTMHKWIHN